VGGGGGGGEWGGHVGAGSRIDLKDTEILLIRMICACIQYIRLSLNSDTYEHTCTYPSRCDYHSIYIHIIHTSIYRPRMD